MSVLNLARWRWPTASSAANRSDSNTSATRFGLTQAEIPEFTRAAYPAVPWPCARCEWLRQNRFPRQPKRSGRSTPSTRKLRSSRFSRGSSPARRNDDLPLPDGPSTTNSDLTPDWHRSQLVQSTHDRRVTTEEDTRVDVLERLPSPKRRTPRILGRRPGEGVRSNSRPVDRTQQLFEGRRVERYGCPVGHRQMGLSALGEQVAALPFGRDVPVADVYEPRAQDPLAKGFRGAVFGLLALVLRRPLSPTPGR